ncbi:hemerythrin domain-containing protein [Vibrio sp. AK197]|uniref:Hemerythrin domain-containing protein n=1 Tax=Vibrio olivae TaxID=1243002 RepID=A0ABV5HKW1_9VIBR
MNNIFDALRESHEKQRLLMDALLKTSGDSKSRREFYAQLKQELQLHAEAEERNFYIPLIKKDSTIDMSRHGISEHHSIDKILAQIDETDFDSPAWLTHMKSLQHQVLHHLEEEEQHIFQMAGKVIGDEQKQDLAAKYQQEMGESVH